MNELMQLSDNGTITSLELVEQINLFRSQDESKSEIGHNDLLKIIRDEFEEEISLGKISQSNYINSRGKEYQMFVLTISQAKQVLVRESKMVRKAVIHYLETIEEKVKALIEASAKEQSKKIDTSATIFENLNRVATLFGLKGNQALISANVATRKITGIDLQSTLGIELKSEDNEAYLTPTEIGKLLDISNRKVNALLTAHDYQDSIDGRYIPLTKGEPFAVMIDSGKKHSDGSMIQQLKWKQSIVEELKVLGEQK
jgi:hypothetical protein